MASKGLLIAAAVFQTYVFVVCYLDLRHVGEVDVRVKQRFKRFGAQDGGFRSVLTLRSEPIQIPPMEQILIPLNCDVRCPTNDTAGESGSEDSGNKKQITLCQPCSIHVEPPATITRSTIDTTETGSRSMMKSTKSGNGRPVTSIDNVNGPIEERIEPRSQRITKLSEIMKLIEREDGFMNRRIGSADGPEIKPTETGSSQILTKIIPEGLPIKKKIFKSKTGQIINPFETSSMLMLKPNVTMSELIQKRTELEYGETKKRIETGKRRTIETGMMNKTEIGPLKRTNKTMSGHIKIHDETRSKKPKGNRACLIKKYIGTRRGVTNNNTEKRGGRTMNQIETRIGSRTNPNKKNGNMIKKLFEIKSRLMKSRRKTGKGLAKAKVRKTGSKKGNSPGILVGPIPDLPRY